MPGNLESFKTFFWQASKQAGRKAGKQEGKQAGRYVHRQAGRHAGRQASTRKAFSRSHALEGLVFKQNIMIYVSHKSEPGPPG